MKKSILSIAAALLMLIGTLGMAQAATTLGTYFHDYGTGEYDPAGNDVLGNDFVTVSDQSTSRFSDSFSFSDLSYDSIESFKLTLNYGEVSSSSPYLEYWWVRPGGVVNTQGWSWGVYKTDYPQFQLTKDGSPKAFYIDNSINTFNSMVASKNFYFWLADEALWANDFKLYSAQLEVIGTPASPTVPVPAAVWLLGSGLVGLVGLKKRRGNK